MATKLTSKITERSQTTLPPAVRTVLGLEPGERLGYVIEGDAVRLVNASAQEHTDPGLERFLSFLGRDIDAHPERLATIPAPLLKRARTLTKRVAIDHDAVIDGAISL